MATCLSLILALVLVERGIKELDLSGHQAAWDAAAKETRQRLVDRFYSKSLLDSVTELAGKNGD